MPTQECVHGRNEMVGDDNSQDSCGLTEAVITCFDAATQLGLPRSIIGPIPKEAVSVGVVFIIGPRLFEAGITNLPRRASQE